MQNWANLYKRGICLNLLYKARPARLVQNGCLRPKRRAAAAGDPPRCGKRLPPVRQTGRDLHLPGRAAGRVGGTSIAAVRSSTPPATDGGRMCTQSSGQTQTKMLKFSKEICWSMHQQCGNPIRQRACEATHDRAQRAGGFYTGRDNPLKIGLVKYDKAGRPSFTVTGLKATLAVNPDTGVIVTCYPTHSRTREKLLEELKEK